MNRRHELGWLRALFLGMIVLALAGCGAGSEGEPAESGPGPAVDTDNGQPEESDVAGEPTDQPGAERIVPETPEQPKFVEKDPVVLIKTTMGSIRVELKPKQAPVTVGNFLDNYVSQGFYDGTIVHHVDKGFMVVAGGYTEDLKPKEPRAFLRNEADNGLKNVRGAVAMTRLPDHVDSATSQFFINLVDNPKLDHKDDEGPETFGYCVFGEVIEGMEVVDRIADVEVVQNGDFPKCPSNAITISSIEVERQ